MPKLQKTERTFGRITGATPAENKFYVLIMFDIRNQKKYNKLIKLLKRYSYRVQKSVFEAYLKTSDYKSMLKGIDKLMRSKHFFDPQDKIRVYKISTVCKVVIYGACERGHIDLVENFFI